MVVTPEKPEYAQRQRLAWIIVIVAFITAVVVVVSIPLGINAVIQRARSPLFVAAQANEGTLGIDYADDSFTAIRAVDQPLSVGAPINLTTTPLDTGLLLFYSEEGADLLSQVQIYGSTSLYLEEASAPRFQLSNEAQQLRLQLTSGRLRLLVANDENRPFIDYIVLTPHGFVQIDEPGEYAMEVDNAETQVTVQQGELWVVAGGEQLTIGAGQRARFGAALALEGPLPSERDLIGNGSFFNGLDGWTLLSWDIERSDQPEGSITMNDSDASPRVRFERVGLGHADGRMRQVLEQDVTDYSSLRLLVTLQIASQSLDVCGNRGSECPLTIQLDYEDQNGAARSWQQGFYAVGTPGPDVPDVCVFCSPPLSVHEQVAYDQVAFRESPDLLALMRQQGIEMRRLKSVTVLAAGHSFAVELIDLALVARQ